MNDMIEEYIAAGVVSDDGVLLIAPESREALARAMRGFKRGDVDVIVRPHFVKRSNRACRYYFGVVVRMISEDTGQDKEAIHDAMCLRFIDPEIVSFVNKTTGEVEERTVPGRSSTLDVSRFYRFVEDVRNFAADWLHVVTPDPDPRWRELDEADERRRLNRRKKAA